MFRSAESSVAFPALEENIVRFWQERKIYEKSLAARAGAESFVFYEGPPTANGLPHPGHCLTRAIKDLFPRYRTMRGYRCDRKGGWDTHGLPVEVEVSKELGIHSKEEIEAYGVEPFIHRCVESVFRYTKQWEQLTERLGFWIHLDEAYVTYHQSYVESVWWALKNLFDRGLLYQGHKIVWWWAQGGTALSSGEVGQGYREVADPSVYVRFPLLDESDTDLLVWTTTPWTLPSNQFAAVKPDLEYSIVELEDELRKVIVASALVETIAGKAGKPFEVCATLAGRDLIGCRYLPPMDDYYRFDGDRQGSLKEGGRQHIAWRVVAADFVTIDTGTGVVHQAPAFGEVDFDVLLSEQARFVDGEGPPLICSVAPDGTFTAEAPDYEGRWVKDADRDIARRLKAEGKLFHQEQYLHDYPFCWRAEEDPLIQYPRKSWFIRTTQFRDRMLANNGRIHWLPEHIQDGRFGNFLETNVDWALSRERFWGTPLPIWICEETGYAEAIADYDELLAKPGVAGTEVWKKAKAARPDLPEDLKVHKPYIDAVSYDSPKAAGKRMRRVSEVIDCWFDSGAMPFAQWGYPKLPGSDRRLAEQFPADFISEAIDQTRGWFYSLLAISTLLFGEEGDRPGAGCSTGFLDGQRPDVEFPHPYRNCVVLGLMLGEDGQKMSKSKRNYREPQQIFDRYGADALRWYFFANQPPWTSIRYNEQAIKESVPEFLLRLWNVYSFFVIYANIDGFDPAASIAGDPRGLTADVLSAGEGYRPIDQRNELDRWILSELNRTTASVIAAMDGYDNFAACTLLNAFVDGLSNWYVRRSRDRFWSGEKTADKLDAYWTLYECLLSTAKLIAPFVPFLSEAVWQNLAVAAFADRPAGATESVHLCDYPVPQSDAVDEQLSDRMALVREIVSLGHSARMGAKLKVRQPLSRVEVVLADTSCRPWLEEHAALIAGELNVKQVEYAQKADQYVSYTVLPDLKRLGPRLGKRLPAVKKALNQCDAAELLAELDAQGQATLQTADGPVTLDSEDIQVRMQAKEGWAAAQGRRCVVVLATELTEGLVLEGLARELIRVIQDRRKEMGCEFTDRIRVGIVTTSEQLGKAIERFGEYIRGETLAVELRLGTLADAEPVELRVAGAELTLYVAVASSPSTTET
ncbi:MAG: isoleucine--tRNA ligase [Rhodopirellula sp.]|nr:isoleucine--tRNA ligase [Rhodopirellula sp.]